MDPTESEEDLSLDGLLDNSGSTALHVFFCIFFTVQSSIHISIITPKSTTFSQYVYEYVVLVLPMIFAHIILSEYITTLNLIIFTVLVYQLYFLFNRNGLNINNLQCKNVFKNDRIPLITSLRGLTYLITGLCILAVDFNDFPEYLAKTRKFGYSLMDTGVGLFIAMSGIVHKDSYKSSFKDIIGGNVKIILILLFLGIGRCVSVKLLDYPEHVTEYGVHWNFFFTIAVCKATSLFLLYIYKNPLLLSIVTLIVHEFLLFIGLQDWVFTFTPRDTLLSANREGITSCLGFVSIYLFAVYLKSTLLNKEVTRYNTLKKLLYWTVLLWVLTYWDFVMPTSRTLSNAAYCIFTDTILMTITTVMYLIIVLCDKNTFHIPLILATINNNGLSYFLIANLCTGAVNLSMNTSKVSTSITFVILNIYMVFTITIVAYLEKLGIKV